MHEASPTATPAESVLFESTGALVTGWNVAVGRVELTATRIVYYRRSWLWMMFGIVGVLLSTRSGGKRELELALAETAGVTRGNFGRNTNVLDIEMADGSEHRLVVDKFDGFVEKFTAVSGQTVAPLPS